MDNSFSKLGFKVRKDLQEACHRYWKYLSGPGGWWTGIEKVAILKEARAAWEYDLCAGKKAALSPKSIKESHQAQAPLSSMIVDAVHRVVTDPARLSKQWIEEMKADGIGYPQIVELIGVVVGGLSIDYLFLGLGCDLPEFPQPEPGLPDRQEPQEAGFHTAWVPTVPPEKATGELRAFYESAASPMGGVAHVMQALSLTPAMLLAFYDLASIIYLPPARVSNPGAETERAITRPQIELLAATVSAANECRY